MHNPKRGVASASPDSFACQSEKLGQPKLPKWFAWHQQAHAQIPEFNGTKCVFAATYPLEADPDDEGPFDLFTKDPKAQLHAILKGGGGVENVQRSGSGLDSL